LGLIRLDEMCLAAKFPDSDLLGLARTARGGGYGKKVINVIKMINVINVLISVLAFLHGNSNVLWHILYGACQPKPLDGSFSSELIVAHCNAFAIKKYYFLHKIE
jgi:hypothetical protein